MRVKIGFFFFYAVYTSFCSATVFNSTHCFSISLALKSYLQVSSIIGMDFNQVLELFYTYGSMECGLQNQLSDSVSFIKVDEPYLIESNNCKCSYFS
jgi:hypothetical protein